jgi:FAD/FMN-containing dehydrogenase
MARWGTFTRDDRGMSGWDGHVRDALVEVVGAAHVLTDPDVTTPYGEDWSGRFAGPVLAVVRPASTDEVAAVVRLCVAAGLPVLPQGGRTGLVGGSVPGANDPPMVVLSTVRLSRLDPVDAAVGQVTAGAGVTIAALHAHARDAGWMYGVDLAARDSCTVGGTVATNAGGIRVCCYGMTRRQVLGVEAVLPDGSVVSHLGGLLKDNTGYDLAGLMVGSEGTLGVVTAARLALHRPPRGSAVALIGVRDAAHALEIVDTAVPHGSRLLAAEIIDSPLLRVICEHASLPWPLRGVHPHVLVLETESVLPGDVSMDLDDDVDVVVAVDAAGKARFWDYRDRAGEAITAFGITHRFDITVPRRSWDAFVVEATSRLEVVDDVELVFSFGHLADGNVHFEVIGPAPDDERVARIVLGTVAELGGSISAEHGVGRAKAPYLSLSRSPAEIAAMRALKQALDPRGLFNPGALLS